MYMFSSEETSVVVVVVLVDVVWDKLQATGGITVSCSSGSFQGSFQGLRVFPGSYQDVFQGSPGTRTLGTLVNNT